MSRARLSTVLIYTGSVLVTVGLAGVFTTLLIGENATVWWWTSGVGFATSLAGVALDYFDAVREYSYRRRAVRLRRLSRWLETVAGRARRLADAMDPHPDFPELSDKEVR